jgi:hypothetical protein
MSHRWNHKVIEIPYKMFAGKLTDRIQQELDRMGAQGWELVDTAYSTSDGTMRLFFKKPG